MEKHPLHIKHPDLQTSPEVERAVKRQKNRTGEQVPNDPAERIEAYVDRLENIFLNPDEKTRKRNLEMLRPKIYDQLLIKRENFPESYFALLQRVARERGEAVEDIPDSVREQMKNTAIDDQKASLDAWMDYLTSDDAVYPAWFKYYVWKNITKLSQFDKERGEFKKRTATTVAPYPDIYREPLAQIADLYEKIKKDNAHLKDQEIQNKFSKKFPKLYAELIQESLAAQIEHREEIQGKWVKYNQGNSQDAETLFQSLENKGTGWCTAGRSTSQTQIESGDFHVYYTNDTNGNPTQPRLAIRMNGDNQIGEVRGVLSHQNVEPILHDTLNEKLNEFGEEADIYRKKSADMKQLTDIEKKVEQGEQLTKDDLTFLYELDSKIEGFGYERDPRIEELRDTRNPEEDMLTIFDCTKEQIAHTPNEINEHTKAYVGELTPGIFQKLPENIKHIYTQFPERRIRREHLAIGGKTAEQLISELKATHINISSYAEDMFRSPEFVAGKTTEEVTLICLTVADLGFTRNATIDQIYERAKELGLELCPPDVGPHYRLNYHNQPLGEWMSIGMEPINDSDGHLNVFSVECYYDGLWLRVGWTNPGFQWLPDRKFVFRSSKSES